MRSRRAESGIRWNPLAAAATATAAATGCERAGDPGKPGAAARRGKLRARSTATRVKKDREPSRAVVRRLSRALSAALAQRRVLAGRAGVGQCSRATRELD